MTATMQYDPFAAIEELKESRAVEFKRAQGADGQGALPQSFFETYSAMANSGGGAVFFGIEEKKNQLALVGVPNPDKVLKELFDGLNDPKRVSANLIDEGRDVEVRSFEGMTVITVTIPAAPRAKRPVYLGTNPMTGTYRRRHSGDYRCDSESVKRMLAEQIEEARDGRVMKNFGLDDINQETLKAYRGQLRAVNPSHPFLAAGDDVDFLRQLGAWAVDRDTGDDGLTLAGLLMFGRYESIHQALPNYVVDYQERPSTLSDDRWIDRVTTDGTWSGNLFDFYRLVMKKLVADLKVPFRLQGASRVDETPVHEALREAFVNTIIHADYTERIPLLVLKRPSGFVFRNPGTMRVPLSAALKGGQSDCRNRKLQKMFQLAGFGEQAGSGVPKIFQHWRTQHWMTPELLERLDPDQTLLQLRMTSLVSQEVLDRIEKEVGEERLRQMSTLEVAALSTAYQQGIVTNQKLRQLTDEHPHDITGVLGKLTREGLLTSIGGGRGTFYVPPSAADEPYLFDELIDLDEAPELEYDLPDSIGQPMEGDVDSIDLAMEFGDVVALVAGQKKVPRELMERALLQLSREDYSTAQHLALALNRNATFLTNDYLKHMVKRGLLQLKFPEQPNHPKQGYRARHL